jgi:acetolactate synthase-1/2/3 large subunit
MGWALPAAVGGTVAYPEKSTTCITGDGSLMMNIQELSTVTSIPGDMKIIVLNNSGYGMVRQTEDQWFDGKYVGTDSRMGDIKFPDFLSLANSFGLRSERVACKESLEFSLNEMYRKKNIDFLEVMIDPNSKVVPQARFGFPLEDSEPKLSRQELKANMIIPLLNEF